MSLSPYIFTQQHRDALFFWNGTWLPQSVPDGARIQIQLPGAPIRWIPKDPGACTPSGPAALAPRAHADYLGGYTLPDRGQISGTSVIYVFDYRVRGPGAVALCLRPDPVPQDPEALGLPAGSPLDYTLTLLVGIPQLSIL